MGDQPGADQGLGVDVAVPQGVAAIAEDLHRLAGLQAFQRRRLGIDLVAVDPAVAGEETAVLIFVQAQGGGGGHGHHSGAGVGGFCLGCGGPGRGLQVLARV